MAKGKFSFLERGFTSFPLRDVGKKFKVVDTVDISFKKPKFIDLKKLGKYMELYVNYREIEEAVWKQIKKDKELLKEADWLVVSMISGFRDEIRVSLDILRET
tara:strand:+ start:47 stop:355 length:309 start_codon:yes stop_codon:yes gene_type:complete